MSVFIVGRRHAPAYDDRHLTHAAVIRPLMLKLLMRMLLMLLMLTGAERSRTNSQHLHVNTPSVSQSLRTALKIFPVLIAISLLGTISGKLLKLFATRYHILKLKCTKFARGSLQRSPRSLGPTSKGNHASTPPLRFFYRPDALPAA